MNFLKYLQPSGLKAAYRKRALETHPDRGKIIGEDEAKMTERFVEATLAYKKLTPFIRGDGRIFVPSDADAEKDEKRTAERKGHENGLSDHFYTGNTPKRELLIGQYLYYTGLISWNTLMKAIVWQKRQRPPVGQIAMRWRMLSEQEIQEILMSKKFGEKFGHFATRKGYLTRFDLMALLGKQNKLQPSIGKYFVERSFFPPREMDEIVARKRIHNRAFSQKKPR